MSGPSLRHAAAVRRFVGEACRAAAYATVRHRLARSADAPASLIGVYRRANAPHVRALVDPALAQGWRIAWWALDEVADELAEHTVGCGPGEKFPLLNEIVDRARVDDGWIVAADDDVAFVRGSTPELLAVCVAAGFALAQPAQVADSNVPVTR